MKNRDLRCMCLHDLVIFDYFVFLGTHRVLEVNYYEKEFYFMVNCFSSNYVSSTMAGSNICQRRWRNGSLFSSVFCDKSTLFCYCWCVCGKGHKKSMESAGSIRSILSDWHMGVFWDEWNSIYSQCVSLSCFGNCGYAGFGSCP